MKASIRLNSTATGRYVGGSYDEGRNFLPGTAVMIRAILLVCATRGVAGQCRAKSPPPPRRTVSRPGSRASPSQLDGGPVSARPAAFRRQRQRGRSPVHALPTTAQGGWPATPEALDCAVRQLALEYAGSLKILDAHGLAAVSDGLQLGLQCPPPAVTASPDAIASGLDFPTALHVDAVHGVDGPGAGTESKPLRTVAAAVSAAALAPRKPVGILLRTNQTHRLNTTLLLGPEHSDTHFVSHPTPGAVLSGGMLIERLRWNPAAESDPHFRGRADGGRGIYVASVPNGTSFIELFDSRGNVSKMMHFALKTRNCVSKTRNCVSKTRHFVFQMMNFAGPPNPRPVAQRSTKRRRSVAAWVRNRDGIAIFCIKIVGICVKNHAFCIKNDGFCIDNDDCNANAQVTDPSSKRVRFYMKNDNFIQILMILC